jgi:tRNA A-37 threonylcarbamoyl transferase component Bud32/tetratricopeptide (TPR) repeat protein
MTDVVSGLRSTLAARYVVEREIGEGATAQVYLARDTRHDRPVALKILRPELANALSGERFLREIRVAAGLQHPNILALYDSGETADSVYFVMPFVEGETLRERLARTGALGIDEAVRILSEIADALTYAHSRGVVHRDVKPENIMLADGHAFIGDFGIAYAARFAPDARLTGEGRVVGTAPYMSPEQAAGDESVDGRSDQYSLACVFHEMLSGRTLYAGRTPRTAASHRLATPPPRLRKSRRDVPADVDRALARALAPDPADRFATPKAFADTVAEALTSAVVTRRVSWRAALSAVLALTAAAAIAVGVRRWQRERMPPLDRSLYAVMPFTHRGDRVPELLGDDCQLLLVNAVSHWRDVRVVDQMRVKSAYAQYTRGSADLRRALTAARSLGAGVMIWGEVRPIGDSVYVRAAVYDVGLGERALREFRVAVARELSDASARFRELADSLLLREPGIGVAADAMGTSSLEAWRAYAAAHRALGDWDLPRARHEFERALQLDPQYPQAYLGLAQAIAFAGITDRSALREAAAHAVALRDRLPPSERNLASALLDLGEGRFQDACGRYGAMLTRDSLDFRAWHGLGECQAADNLVVADPRTRSGWRFRSSHAAAIAAYSRALTLTPAVHRAFRGRAFARLTALFHVEMNRTKLGYRLIGSDTIRYGAFPELNGDTLTFVPYRAMDLFAGADGTKPPSQPPAVARNRELLRAITDRWVRSFPASPDAAESHAHSLDATGQLTSALDFARRARALARDRTQRFRLGATEVRLLLKSGAFEPAARMADSLLAASRPRDAETAMRAAGLAALTGRVHAAASLSGEAGPALSPLLAPALPDGRPVSVPTAVLGLELALSAYAAFAAPADSIRAHWQRLAGASLRQVPAERRSRASAALLHRPAALAYEVLGPTALHSTPPENAMLILEQQVALLRGDTAMVRAHADTTIAEARATPSAPLSTTYVFHTARQLLGTKDTLRASALLDLLLDALPSAPADLLDDAVDGATLVRAMALRAELAAAARDTTRAVRWASAAATLWRAADAPLADKVARMRSIAAQARR